ncbi:putative E3 ubiquitin-protein ligase LIN isoform X2 [Alnus glutinosa]|uniref:putative E3 ubiquitin-protein ligase LIN isoform X2 n=1 Tax=Alnus glutinosa TaxID=3517 RepID=UPI002D7686D1|nr:putative E3 ubiquitin-protein ligase LIN isoform X2 [Alnus glutinosa]
MASSLEELLSEEGFKGRRSLSRARSCVKADATGMSFCTFQDKHKNDSAPGHRNKTERTRSDVARYSSKGELPTGDYIRGRRSGENLVGTEKKDERLKKENRERLLNYLKEGKRFNLSKDVPQNEIEEVCKQDDERFGDTYSNKVHSSERGKDEYSNGAREREVYKERPGMDRKVDKKHGNNLAKQLLGHMSSSTNNRKSVKKPTTSNDTSNRGSLNSKSFEDNQSKRRNNFAQVVYEPALDEVAVQAIVSILNGYIKSFLNDEDFRTTLRHNCFSSIDFIELEERQSAESKVMASLEQAIETVEKAAEDSSSAKDLKKALVQLSAITGLYSNNLKDGFASGIPNSKLSACAHLYLSVIYKLQKKDKISAKHLLQVFCIVPFQARTILLPELWDYLFFPHLSHLKEWYNQEADSLADTPSRQRKLKLLQEVYNDILDSGTYQFSAYYKDWLTEGVEAPSLPSVQIPPVSVWEAQQGSSLGDSSELSNSSGPFSSQPVVSKKLYDAVFGCSSKSGVDEAEDDGETGNSNNRMRSFGGSAVVKQTLTGASETVECTNQDTDEDSTESVLDDAFLPENEPSSTAEKEWRLYVPIKIRSSLEELRGSYEYFDEHSFFSSIPQGFICPFTGKLFEDPVTIETGQTFERVAIKAWFDQGNRKCPVTGKTLESLSVPLTNFVLKRVIDNWRSGHCKNLLAFASQVMENSGRHGLKHLDETVVFILEQLLTAFNEEEKRTNARHIISLGGLHFLLQRFEVGKLEEKAHVAALLSCCIDADASCRNQIARNISKQCLLELLQSKQVKSRTNAVLLLVELICLKRWKDVTLFLSGLQNEGIADTMYVLLVYLHSSPKEQRPLVAVLLLHLDLLVEPQKYSIYREEAIDAITMALEDSLVDEKVREKCCRALLILGRRFSFSGKSLTESWILKQAGFKDIYEVNLLENEDDNSLADDTVWDDEEVANEEWLKNLSMALLSNGKKSFLDTVSKCLRSGNSDMVRVCLTTVAWLSCALSSQSDVEFQHSAFSALIFGLKESLEKGEQIEYKILASMSLLYFSKISECRVLLMAMAKEIAAPLRSLAGVTWTAKQLYAIVSGGDL